LIEKRLELLRLKRAQLEARRQSDPALDARSRASRRGSRPTRRPAPAVAEPDKSVIQLKKKTADGSFVPVSAP
jgi:hypothetical protein